MQHVALQPFQHLVGLVPANSRPHHMNFDAVGFQAALHPAHVAGRVPDSTLGNRIAQKRHGIARLEQRFLGEPR